MGSAISTPSQTFLELKPLQPEIASMRDFALAPLHETTLDIALLRQERS